MKQSKCLAYDGMNLNSLNVPFYFVQHIWHEQKLKLNLTGCLACVKDKPTCWSAGGAERSRDWLNNLTSSWLADRQA